MLFLITMTFKNKEDSHNNERQKQFSADEMSG